MTKTDILAKLTKMRERIESEGREPNFSERKESQKLLEELDELEARQAFDNNYYEPSQKPYRTPVDSRQEVEERRESGRFASLGEQLISVYQSGLPGGRTDRRLYQIAEKRAASGLSEGTPSEGGFLVDQDFSSMLLETIWAESQILNQIPKLPISANSNGIKVPGIDESSRVDGSRAGGIRAYWKSEAAEKTKSKPTFRQIELDLNKLIGVAYTTDEMLSDAPLLDRVITNGFRKEFAFMLTNGVINGTGVGQLLGFMQSGCLITVSKQAGQASQTVVAENIFDMYSRLFASSKKSAMWLINQDILPQLYSMSIAVGTGGIPVFQPANGIAGQPYNSLLGCPVIEIEQAQTLGTIGDITLCDFKNGYIMAEKGGLQKDISIHVRFIYDESVFRFVLRIDGQPVLASPVTPFTGTNTQSHFIALETRS